MSSITRRSGVREQLIGLAGVGITFTLLSACGAGSLSITEARAKGTGTEVTIEGSVTVAPGTFKSAMDDEGFALQDSSGGVYVKMAEKQAFGVGAKVRVTGTLDEQNKLGIVKAVPTGVKLLEGTQQVSPKAVASNLSLSPKPAPPATPVPIPTATTTPTPGAAPSVATPLAAPTGSCPAAPPRVGPRADRPRYTLTVDIRPVEHVASGDMTVVFTPDEAIDHLVARFWPNGPVLTQEGAHLAAGPVTVDGSPATPSQPDPTTMIVPLSRPLAAGQSVTLSMPWRLTLPGNVRDRIGDDGPAVRMGTFYPLLSWEPGVGWATDPPTTVYAEATTSPARPLAVALIAGARASADAG